VIVKRIGPGISLTATNPKEHIQSINVSRDNAVILFIRLGPKFAGTIDELLQYLTPQEAIALADALVACAHYKEDI
jgi:hypothetical protein